MQLSNGVYNMDDSKFKIETESKLNIMLMEIKFWSFILLVSQAFQIFLMFLFASK